MARSGAAGGAAAPPRSRDAAICQPPATLRAVQSSPALRRMPRSAAGRSLRLGAPERRPTALTHSCRAALDRAGA